jgi:SAM-dependent methyltransferase
LPDRTLRHETRTPEQVREHYLLEKRLAARLLAAGREERRTLYGAVYDELYRSVPHHPMVVARHDTGHDRAELEKQRAFLAPYLRHDTIFLEVGAGDSSLSLAVAPQVQRVYAVDVSAELAPEKPPANFQLLLSSGCDIPLPDQSVTLAFSNQLMEHLHPDDAEEQLRSIQRVLVPGGIYLCITPNRLNGPHDVSRAFDDVATGFHLREYTTGELRRLFLRSGFDRLQVRIGGGRTFAPCPVLPILALEGLLAALPAAARRSLGSRKPMRALLGVRLAAHKRTAGP